MRPASFVAFRPARLLTAIVIAFLAMIAGPASAAALDRGAQPVANTSCGSVLLEGSVPYKLTIEKGSPSCSTVRRILKRFGHPLNKKPKFNCPSKGYECEYSIYPEGWRCGGFFQGNFQCWHGANSPVRADEVFSGSEDLSAQADARRTARAPCTKKAIKVGLGRGNGRLLTGTSFKCAGRFAYADVMIADYEAVQLLRSSGRHWKVVDRAKYCEAGVVPAKIRYFACEVS